MGVLRKLAQVAAGRALLVICETYIEFSPADTAVDLLKNSRVVIIVRSQSVCTCRDCGAASSCPLRA